MRLHCKIIIVRDASTLQLLYKNFNELLSFHGLKNKALNKFKTLFTQ